MSDRTLGVACLALAAFIVWQATLIQTGFIVDPLGPRRFPIIIAATLVIAGLYPIVRPDPRPDWPAVGRLIEIAFAVAVMIGYAQALSRLGFVVSTTVAASLLGWRLGSRPIAAALAGSVIAIAIYAIFHVVLGLSLARGPWGF